MNLMNLVPRPTPAEERWLELADRYPALRAAAEARAGGWRTASPSSRALMFVLGWFAAALIVGSLLLVPGRLLVAGLLMLGVGEWVIRSRRLVAGGFEEAMLACGAGASLAQMLTWLEPLGDGVILLAASLTLLGVGLRLGNALFTTLAALAFTAAVACTGTATLFGSRVHAGMAAACSAAMALGALALGARRWQRPSHDRMLDGLVLAMSVATWGWMLAMRPTTRGGGALALLVALGLASLLAVTGVRRRSTAPLFGALLMVACLAISLRPWVHVPLHAYLMTWGAVMLLVAVVLDRRLRRPVRGITSAPLQGDRRLEELLQLHGASSLAPTHASHSGAATGGGGEFGGGGASGRF